jgi:hypothetical protein
VSAGGKRALAALSILLGIGVLAWIVRGLDLGAARHAMGRAGAGGMAAFAALCALILCLQSLGWHALMRSRGWEIPVSATLRSMLMANALAWVTPSMYLGGEPLRIWHVSARYGRPSEEVAATVAVHKFAEFAGFIVALLASLGAVLWASGLPHRLRVASTAVSGALLLLFVLLAAAFAGRWPLASGLLRALGKRGERCRRWAESAEAAIEACLREHRAAFAAALVLTGGPAALILAKPLVFFWFLGKTLPFPQLALVFVLTQLVLALQFTPGGIGLFEGGVLGTFALIGVEAPEAAAYAAAQRIADAMLVGAGTLFAMREGAAGFFRGAGPGDSKADGRRPS